jgi:glyoxylase-like metal-dependent hydrolase (beta-lactamase superfamily II)
MESLAAFAYRGGGFGDKREFSMAPILVRHPSGDLLFDTGFGRNVDAQVQTLSKLMQSTTTYVKATPAADQLAANGIDPERLAGVILTHAHWDHVSGLDGFPGVPVWMTGDEKTFIESGHEATLIARSLPPLNYRLYSFEDGPYLGFPKSHDVWGDGSVVLVPVPGHTPGSIVAFITLPSGARYALVGDLVWQTEGIEIPAERPWLSRRLVDNDPEGVRRHIGHVAALHRQFPEIRIVPAHDGRVAASLPVLPEMAQ